MLEFVGKQHFTLGGDLHLKDLTHEEHKR